MVQMSSETTVIGGASRMSQPSVNYQPTVRQPVSNRIRSPMKEEGTDWGEAIASSIDSIARAYGEGQKLQAKQKAADAEAQAESNKQGLMNQLAQEVGVVVEEQRQGAISPTAAETRIRGIQMNYLTSYSNILSEKDISDNIGRNAYGLNTIEKDRVTKRMGFAEESRKNQIAKLQTDNPSLQYLPLDQVGSLMDTQNQLTDNLNTIRYQKSLAVPGSEAAQLLDQKEKSLIEKNAFLNVGRVLNNYLSQGQPITGSTLQEAKLQLREGALKSGISEQEFAISFDRAVKEYGYAGIADGTSKAIKLSTEEQQAAITNLITSSKGRVMSVPGMAMTYAIGGKAAEQMMIDVSFNRDPQAYYNMVDTVMKNLKTEDGQGQAAAKDIPANAVAPLIKGTANALSNGNTSLYTRGVLAATVLEAFNNRNPYSNDMSAEQKNIIVRNTNGTFGLLNPQVLNNLSTRLKNSDDPEQNQLGYQIERASEIADAKSIAAAISTKGHIASPDYRSLASSFVSRAIRYDEDGNVFLSNADAGALGALGKTFNFVDYNKNLTNLNNGLSNLDKTTRLEVLKNLGFKPISEGEDTSFAQILGKVNEEVVSRMNPTIAQFISEHAEEFDKFLLGSGQVENTPSLWEQAVSGSQQDAQGIMQRISPFVNGTIKAIQDVPSTDELGYRATQAAGNLVEQSAQDADVMLRSGLDVVKQMSGYKDPGQEAQDMAVKILDEGPKAVRASSSVHNSIPLTFPHIDTEASDMIKSIAAEYGYDEALSRAVMYHESKGEQSAKSHVGAKGAMQIMPKTWNKEIAPALGYKESDINDKEKNIRGGMWYLDKMLKQAGGDEVKALSYYNWGSGNTEEAVKKYGENWLEHAPKETQEYVLKVLGDRYGEGTQGFDTSYIKEGMERNQREDAAERMSQQARENEFNNWFQSNKESGRIAAEDNGDDYDWKGYFEDSEMPKKLKKGQHFPDKYKKPNHDTFSDESVYATGDLKQLAGHWKDSDTYVPTYQKALQLIKKEASISKSLENIALRGAGSRSKQYKKLREYRDFLRELVDNYYDYGKKPQDEEVY